MKDPFPIPAPAALQAAITPLADLLSLPTLPLHFHEVLLAFLFYISINTYLSPWLSRRLCPATYNSLNTRTRINWDVHVVSFCQSLIVNALALYVIFCDEERRDMNWTGRIWGYTGASGLVQAFASGYFLWDLWITARHVGIFGWGMLAHARPFVNFYGPIFILYELSSPFLNIHWFCDKLALTGSIYQLINGIILMTTFFLCRLVWGALNSYWVFADMYRALRHGHLVSDGDLGVKMGLAQDTQPATNENTGPTAEIMAFAGDRTLPLWLPLSYLVSNIVLNLLNYYWFGQMIKTIRKRFEPPFGTKGVEDKHTKRGTKTKTKTEKVGKEEVEVGLGDGKPAVGYARGVYDDGRKTVEVEGRELRSRRRG
ncbi:hypothetical protein M8818_007024 [Zalaria obscura]|uniref:Uncharacterized protein n=1 Tax=Zalaria obscura TaxID=2024903 RepID=A0ACC3S3U3_9PEZI